MVLISMNVIVQLLEADDVGGICQIEDQYKSPYVTALLTESVSSYGCMSSELVPETRQQVDVLLVNVSSSGTSDVADIQHESSAWTTSGHHKQHIYLTVKPSAVYGMLLFSAAYIGSFKLRLRSVCHS